MTKKYKISLFIFRRDIRLVDNTGLINALIYSESVIPLFIVTPTQVSSKNKYKSSNAIQFMIKSLYDLDDQINKSNKKCRLWITYGEEISIIKKIYNIFQFDAIFLNDDYTPYAVERDVKIKKYCANNQIDCNTFTDILLLDDAKIYAKNGNPYHNFTLFYKKALQFRIRDVDNYTDSNFRSLPKKLINWTINVIDDYLIKKKFYRINNNLAVVGGREYGLDILSNIKFFKNYKNTKNFPSFNTTKLSAHNKFGTVSIREVYDAFFVDKTGELRKNLYWRDFYYYVSINFKYFYQYEHIFREPVKNNFGWENSQDLYRAWCDGDTGFPFVDAAMIQLNTTGFMHNRARLVVSEFLVKNLLIDWKYGEKYFTKKLVDIDRAQNLGNWNWSASYGLDSTPFLRIFNPWNQSKKYDPDCKYIKKWLPVLKNVRPSHIHTWYKNYKLYSDIDYPKPIVDQSLRAKKFKKMYKIYFDLK